MSSPFLYSEWERFIS